MALLLQASTSTTWALWKVNKANFSERDKPLKFGYSLKMKRMRLAVYNPRNRGTNTTTVNACFFNLPDTEEPLLKEAIKEPAAFMGGIFAGLLKLDLNEDPLKEWVSRIVESAGIKEEEIEAEGYNPDEAPEQIDIE